MILKEIEPIIHEIVKNDIEDVLLAQWVDKINSHNHLDRRILIFSESGFGLCRAKAFSKVPEMTKFFSWFDLRSVELSDNIFKFTFSTVEISFSFNQISNLFDILCQHLSNILTPSEYPKIIAGSNYRIPIENYIPISAIGGISRLKARILNSNEGSDEIRSLLKSYSNVLSSGMNKINLGLFGESRFINEVVDSFNAVPHITSIVFPSKKNSPSHWNGFINLIKHSRFIKEITTHEEITEDFYQIESIKKEETTGVVQSILFGNLGISNKEMSAIANFYKNCGIEEIKFIGIKYAMPSFKLNFNTFTSNSNFKSVSLDKILSLNVLSTLRLLRNVERVGITGCNIEISEAIPIICSLNGTIKIKSIDLSYNESNFPLSKTNLPLPDWVEELHFDYVKFRGTSLQVLLSYFECQSQMNLSIHLNNIDLEKDYQQSLFKFAEKYSYSDSSFLENDSSPSFNLGKLYWNNNIISKSLLKFFFRNESLSLLSLNGLEFESENEIIKDLVNYIKSLKHLRELHLSGNLKYQFPPEMLELVIPSIANGQKTIKYLDISSHQYRPESLAILSEILVSNRNIEYVNFSNNGVYRLNAWQSFFKSLLKRGKPLDFVVPHVEFVEMLRSKEASIEDLTELYKLIEKVKKGNPQIVIPPEENADNADESEKNSEESVNKQTEVINIGKSKSQDSSDIKFSWEITEIPVKDFDNESILNSFEKDFGFDFLLDQIKS